MRLLHGESLDVLSRDTGQPAAAPSGWRDEFLESDVAALKRRTGDSKELALERKCKRVKRLAETW